MLLCAVSRLVFTETSCCRPRKCHISTEQLPEAMPVTWEASFPGQYMILALSPCAGTVYALECARPFGAAVHMYGFNWHDKHGDTHPRIREEYAYVQNAEQDGLLIVHPTGVLLFSQVRCCDSGWKTTSPQCSRLGTETRVGLPDAACFPILLLPHPMLGPLERLCALCSMCWAEVLREGCEEGRKARLPHSWHECSGQGCVQVHRKLCQAETSPARVKE